MSLYNSGSAERKEKRKKEEKTKKSRAEGSVAYFPSRVAAEICASNYVAESETGNSDTDIVHITAVYLVFLSTTNCSVFPIQTLGLRMPMVT
jgi:hypothetical protein